MFKSIAISIINFYQKRISIIRPQSPCRFDPTCSQYSKEAITRYGILKGGVLSIGRIGRCHPFSSGGHDPVK